MKALIDLWSAHPEVTELAEFVSGAEPPIGAVPEE